MFIDWEKGPIELSLLQVYCERSKYYLDTKLVYIGQAFGKSEQRLQAEELMSDPMLQKIERDMLRQYTE